MKGNSVWTFGIIRWLALVPVLLVISFAANAWEYSEEADKMRGVVRKYASTESKDTIPFGGFAQLRVSLGVRKTGNSQSDAYLHIGTAFGAFGCISRCRVNIKFDGGPITEIEVTTSDTLRTMFIASPDDFIDKLKHAKKLIVETAFVSSGTYQLEFDVSGLQWPQ
jgi:hypothetical protein